MFDDNWMRRERVRPYMEKLWPLKVAVDEAMYLIETRESMDSSQTENFLIAVDQTLNTLTHGKYRITFVPTGKIGTE